uniref:Endonuclease/exonuclease/phosphatase domain-containing protein n=1 Tax=Angiostrongylus cantonensis TaxID=6313 RepID=A0A0K0CXP8_ANGCA
MRQKRSRRRQRSRPHEFVHEHRFIRTAYNANRMFTKRCGSIPALTIFVIYAATSNYDEQEVEAFYMDLEKFYREDHTFFKVIIGDFNAKKRNRQHHSK